MHTKLKLEADRSFPQDIRSEDTYIFASTENTIYDEPARNRHAAELVRRWNAHDELLEALKMANGLINEHFGITDNDEAGNPTHDKIRAAIATKGQEG